MKQNVAFVISCFIQYIILRIYIISYIVSIARSKH